MKTSTGKAKKVDELRFAAMKECRKCGCSFQAHTKRSDAIYCSYECRRRAGMDRTREKRKLLVIPDNLRELVEKNCEAVTESGCWLWAGQSSKLGYGRLAIGGQQSLGAHRASYMAFKGPIPDGLFVCHKCDTPQCVNPNHLFLGTHSDNMKDAVKKGRRVHIVPPLIYGEKHPQTTLTEEQVRKIRCSTEPNKILAKKYNVDSSTIGNIKRRNTWKHL